MPHGTLSVDLAVTGGGFRDRHVQDCPDIGPACDSVAVAPNEHDLKIAAVTLTLGARWGFARGWALETLVPLRVDRQRIVFRTLDGTPFTPDPPDFHHSDRTISGLADPWLVLARGATRGSWSLGVRAGASLPVGSTVDNPFALGERGLPHEHVQLGSGTVQPILGLGVGRAFDGAGATLLGLARLGVAGNRHGYRAGDQWLAQALATSALGVPHASFALGPTLFHETAETWDGRRESEGNLGRTDLHAEARAGWNPPGLGLVLGGELRVPLWTRAEGAQLDLPLTIRLSVEKTFGDPAP